MTAISAGTVTVTLAVKNSFYSEICEIRTPVATVNVSVSSVRVNGTQKCILWHSSVLILQNVFVSQDFIQQVSQYSYLTGS